MSFHDIPNSNGGMPVERVTDQLSPEQHLLERIDGWIRRRVRLCYWKQWRWCRTKIRNLLKLGVQLGTSIWAGLNSGGPWAMARRLAAQHGMTNQWLKDQGLVSVKDCG